VSRCLPLIGSGPPGSRTNSRACCTHTWLVCVVLIPGVSGIKSMLTNHPGVPRMSCYELPSNAFPHLVVSTENPLLPPEAYAVDVEQYLIDRGRVNHHHRSEQARNNACEQGRRRKEKRQKKAAQRAAAL